MPLAARLAENLLSTYQWRLRSVNLVPGEDEVFDVRINDDLLFSRHQEDRLPTIDEVRQAVGAKIRAARSA
ncbi:MAG TPA: Rdx family protein [Dehalococcoidia bacterium]|nr:Rdx family protein [Dehalococcoidia bacterium]